jgi:hypothetical protein
MQNSPDSKQRLLMPNTTQIPNVMLDEWLTVLSGSEWKVACYIARHTYGFGKLADGISQSQMLRGIRRRDGTYLDRGVGLDKKTLLKALKTLEDQGRVDRDRRRSDTKGDEPTVYRLILTTHVAEGQQSDDSADSSGESPHPVVEEFPHGGGGESPPGPWGKNSPTQYPVEQNPSLISNSSNDEKDEEKENADGIRVESTASEAVRPPQVPPEGSQTTANGPQASRPRSEIPPIGQVLQRRVAAMGKKRAQPPMNQPSMTSAPPTESHVTPSSDRRWASDPAVGELDASPPSAAERSAGGSTGGSRRRVRASLQIEAIVTQFSREFLDVEHLQSNINQAARLWKVSGRSEQTFCQLLFDAATATRKQGGVRNKMAYYFRVLRQLLGLVDSQG